MIALGGEFNILEHLLGIEHPLQVTPQVLANAAFLVSVAPASSFIIGLTLVANAGPLLDLHPSWHSRQLYIDGGYLYCVLEEGSEFPKGLPGYVQ